MAVGAGGAVVLVISGVFEFLLVVGATVSISLLGVWSWRFFVHSCGVDVCYSGELYQRYRMGRTILAVVDKGDGVLPGLLRSLA